MVEASALALADALIPEERAEDLLYPRITRIRDVSAEVAMKVIRTAQNEVRVYLRT